MDLNHPCAANFSVANFVREIFLFLRPFFYVGVEPKIGGFDPPKWMVKIMENPMNKWMIWGAHPYFWKHPRASKRCQVSQVS